MGQIERFRDTPQMVYVRGKSGQIYQVSPLVPGAMPLEQLQFHIPQSRTAPSKLAVGVFLGIGAMVLGSMTTLVGVTVANNATAERTRPVIVQPAPPAICSNGFLRGERRC